MNKTTSFPSLRGMNSTQWRREILPLPGDILPSAAFMMRTRGLLLGLTRSKSIKAA